MMKKIKDIVNHDIKKDGDYSFIEDKIDFDKYTSEKKNMFFRHPVVSSVFALVFLMVSVLLGENLYTISYNKKVDAYNEELLASQNTGFYELKKADSLKKVKTLKAKEKRKSLLSYLTTAYLPKSNSASLTGEVVWEEETSPGTEENSFDTNIQTDGVDEEDYSKCDGTYIYQLDTDGLTIYDLNGNFIASYNEITGDEYYLKGIYVKGKEIIIVYERDVLFLHFEDGQIKPVNHLAYKEVIDTRLTGNFLYTVGSLSLDTMKGDSEFYYDEATSEDIVYSLCKYDLVNDTYESVNDLNNGDVDLYMSDSHIYLATSVYLYKDGRGVKNVTCTSVFDYDLCPVGTFKTEGTVLNQFSLNEKDGNFFIVTTDILKNNKNRLYVFSLSEKKLKGSLEEGIGKVGQSVRSVRYQGDNCYVCTYRNTDPLYQIDLSDPEKPYIRSLVEAPGYSSYLHTFEINSVNYVLGFGYTDNSEERKISLYRQEEELVQIGKDVVISPLNYDNYEGSLITVKNLNYGNISSHKDYFIYNDGTYFYFGLKLEYDQYYIFKADVENEDISVYKKIYDSTSYTHSRCYLVGGKIHITVKGSIIISDF